MRFMISLATISQILPVLIAGFAIVFFKAFVKNASDQINRGKKKDQRGTKRRIVTSDELRGQSICFEPGVVASV